MAPPKELLNRSWQIGTVSIASAPNDSVWPGTTFTLEQSTELRTWLEALPAGAVALLAAAKPNLSADGIKAALLGSMDVSSAFKRKVVSNGRPNVARGMQNLTNADLLPIVITAVEYLDHLPAQLDGRGATWLDCG